MSAESMAASCASIEVSISAPGQQVVRATRFKDHFSEPAAQRAAATFYGLARVLAPANIPNGVINPGSGAACASSVTGENFMKICVK